MADVELETAEPTVEDIGRTELQDFGQADTAAVAVEDVALVAEVGADTTSDVGCDSMAPECIDRQPDDPDVAAAPDSRPGDADGEAEVLDVPADTASDVLDILADAAPDDVEAFLDGTGKQMDTSDVEAGSDIGVTAPDAASESDSSDAGPQVAWSLSIPGSVSSLACNATEELCVALSHTQSEFFGEIVTAFTPDGGESWSVELHSGYYPSISVDGTDVFIAGVRDEYGDAYVARLGPAGVVWTFQSEDPVVSTSHAVGAEGTVFYSDGTTLVAALSGEAAWKSDHAWSGVGKADLAPSIVGDHVMLVDADGVLWAFAVTSGELAWTRTVPAGVVRCGAVPASASSVVVSGGGGGAAFASTAPAVDLVEVVSSLQGFTSCPVQLDTGATLLVVGSVAVALDGPEILWQELNPYLNWKGVPAAAQGGGAFVVGGGGLNPHAVTIGPAGSVATKPLPVESAGSTHSWVLLSEHRLLIATAEGVTALSTVGASRSTTNNWGTEHADIGNTRRIAVTP